jgi:hypothetical protein
MQTPGIVINLLDQGPYFLTNPQRLYVLKIFTNTDITYSNYTIHLIMYVSGFVRSKNSLKSVPYSFRPTSLAVCSSHLFSYNMLPETCQVLPRAVDQILSIYIKFPFFFSFCWFKSLVFFSYFWNWVSTSFLSLATGCLYFTPGPNSSWKCACVLVLLQTIEG